MLDEIKTPEDVRSLNFEKIGILCKEIRNRIIEVTSKKGGHLAPSLGTVELTVALLKVFDPLKNRIVWDVGHQSYAYKILTERNKDFDNLRQYKGLSGFNNISESKYDAFGVGHSSTSISAALGIYLGKELNNKPEKVIVVIGDGAMTAGEAYEGLNNLGGLKKDIIIILNDNEMSISKNVGAIHKYLANILSGKHYNKIKKEVWDTVQTLPKSIRSTIISGIRHIENIKSVLYQHSFFEDIGFKYIGPLDGHNIPTMVKILKNTKEHVFGPCVLHVVTKKGKGYSYAEKDATKFHGISAFNNKTGVVNGTKAQKLKLTYSELYGRTLIDLAKKDEKIVAITAAMTQGTGLEEFKNRFPQRFFDVGIAEQHAVTFAAGLSLEKIKPFVTIYSTFLQRAYDQIIHDVALQNLQVKFAVDRSGLVGSDGPTHHGTFDLSYLTCIPNMTIIAPRDGNEFIKMIKYMAGFKKGPIAIRYPRGKINNYPELSNSKISFGKAEIVYEGKELAIITIGAIFEIGYRVYKRLVEKNCKPFLINARFAKPIEEKLLTDLEAKGVKKIISIENNAIKNGFGAAILEKINDLELPISIKMFGIPDKFVTFGKIEQLNKLIGLNEENIFKYCLKYYDKTL